MTEPFAFTLEQSYASVGLGWHERPASFCHNMPGARTQWCRHIHHSRLLVTHNREVRQRIDTGVCIAKMHKWLMIAPNPVAAFRVWQGIEDRMGYGGLWL